MQGHRHGGSRSWVEMGLGSAIGVGWFAMLLVGGISALAALGIMIACLIGISVLDVRLRWGHRAHPAEGEVAAWKFLLLPPIVVAGLFSTLLIESWFGFSTLIERWLGLDTLPQIVTVVLSWLLPGLFEIAAISLSLYVLLFPELKLSRPNDTRMHWVPLLSPALRRTLAVVLIPVVSAQMVGAVLYIAYQQAPCSQLDVKRRGEGCQMLIELPREAEALGAGADGTLLAGTYLYDGAGYTSELQLWSSDGQQRSTIAPGADWMLYDNPAVISPDGAVMATALPDGRLQLWRTADSTPLRTITGPATPASRLVFSSDSALLASAGADGINVWRIADGALLTMVAEESQLVALSQNELLATAVISTAKIWNVQDGALMRTITPGYVIENLALSADGSTLVSTSYDGQIDVWRVQDGTLIQSIGHNVYEHSLNAVALSSDGALLLTLGLRQGPRDTQPVLWQVADGMPLRTFDIDEHPLGAVERPTGAAFTPDGTSVIFTSENAATVWRLVE